MKLTTDRLILREISTKDKTILMKNMNNLNIAAFLLEVPYPFKNKDAESWINFAIKESKKKKRDYVFAITIKGNDSMIGEVILNDFDYYRKSAALSYWLSESEWKKGIIQEAVKKVMEFAFIELKLKRLELAAFTDNLASNQVAKKLGFIYEGVKRQASYAESTKKFHDDNVYSMIDEDFKNLI
ncbi:MAG: GNAT family protein [Candidatus Pacearchaeota archaeon]|jgi:RimJ/RimL family protein N-acetyltransferase